MPESESPNRAEPEEEYVPEYFFTMKYPHKWSFGGGEDLMTLNPETWEPFASLDEVKAMAESKRVGGWGDDRCETSYGVRYIPRRRKHN